MNRELLEHLLDNAFFSNIYDELNIYLLDSPTFEYYEYFESLIDYVDLDSLGCTDLIDFEMDESLNEYQIKGNAQVSASVDGYVYWDGENHYLESAEIDFIIEFTFIIRDDQYYDFEVMEIQSI